MGQVFTPDKISNLSITGAKTADLSSSTMTIGGQQYRNSSVISLDLSTSGVGGLDTGSVAASTTYYVYVVLSGGIPSLIASLDPDTTGPTGHTSWKLVGALETDGAIDVSFVYEQDEGTPQKDVFGVQSRQQEIESPSRQVNNLIINGGMDIWQRDTNTAIVAGTNYTNADRYIFRSGGAGGGTGTHNRSTLVPSDQFKYSHATVGTSPGASSSRMAQLIEGQNCRPFIGKTMTASMWVLMDTLPAAATTFAVAYNNTGAGEDDWGGPDLNNGFNIASVDVNSAVGNGWTRFSLTFVMPPEAVNGMLMSLGVRIDSGITTRSTGWMLHEGNCPVDFQRAGSNMQDELAMCQRYYRQWPCGSGYFGPVFAHGHGTTQLRGSFGSMAVGMRTLVPVATYTDDGTGGDWNAVDASGNISLANGTVINVIDGHRFSETVTGAVNSKMYYVEAGPSGGWKIEDEL